MNKQRIADIQARLEAGYTGDLGQYVSDTRADIRYLLAQLAEAQAANKCHKCPYEKTVGCHCARAGWRDSQQTEEEVTDGQ